jgi:flagellin-like hook-associated protein FlgL
MTTQVNLTAAINANLLSLQNTQTLLNQTQLSLSTGKKVNSALDNPEAFFAAQALTNRAGDLSNVLDGISQGVQTIQTANDGITAITSLLQQAQSVAQQALSESNANAGGTPTDAASLKASFNQILAQITNLANDASYQGTNLLNSATNSLTITYDETGHSTQTIQGVNFTAGSTGTGGSATNSFVSPQGGGVVLPTSGNINGSADAFTIQVGSGPVTTINVGSHTAASVVAQLNAVSGISASIDKSGNLLILTTTPGASLHIIDTTGGASDLGLPTGTTPPNTLGSGLGINDAQTGGAYDWGSNSYGAEAIQGSLNQIAAALTAVRAQASTLGQNLGTVQTYQSFNKNLINDLNAGANDLTAADTNQESAALLTLQTQQQLGISALSLASQAQQAVLKLFP